MKDYENFFEDLKGLIAIKSVKGKSKASAPFGEEVKAALNYVLALGKSWGFDVFNYDDYMGEISFGKGEEVGVIGHVDVVPEGSGWNTPPYALVDGGDRLYGRGTTDDKGPLLLALYALKALKDEGKTFNKRIRVFIGTDEESGWGDVEYFLKEHSFPDYGFSPDGNYPVCYAEKGPNKIVFQIPFGDNYTCFTAGVAPNAVPAYAFIKGEATEEELKKFGLKRNGELIESFGKAAHGSYPELGENAVLPLLKFLQYKGEPVQDVIKYLFDDILNIQQIKDETGNATMSPNMVEQKDGVLKITVDFRVPATMNLRNFIPYFDKMGIKYTAYKSRDPHYVDKNDAFVQTLLSAYNKVMKTSEVPVAQRGGTFASVFKMGVAFGPEYPGTDNHIHEPNEFIKKEELETTYNIYYTALKELIK